MRIKMKKINRGDIYKKTAKEVLVLAGFDNIIPLPIEELVKKLGITLSKEFDIKKLKFSGAINHKDGITSIWVNPMDSKLRQRFTIAHEIGHYIHDFPLELVNQEIGDTPRTILKSPIPMETNANNFAGQLLMPKSKVLEMGQKLVTDHPDVSGNEIVKRLAEKFEVSVPAMTVRLKVLGVISQ